MDAVSEGWRWPLRGARCHLPRPPSPALTSPKCAPRQSGPGASCPHRHWSEPVPDGDICSEGKAHGFSHCPFKGHLRRRRWNVRALAPSADPWVCLCCLHGRARLTRLPAFVNSAAPGWTASADVLSSSADMVSICDPTCSLSPPVKRRAPQVLSREQ